MSVPVCSVFSSEPVSSRSTQLLQFTTFFISFSKSNDLSHERSISKKKKTTPILHFGLSCSLFSSLSFPICYFINLHRTLKVFAYFSFFCAIINIPVRPKGSSDSLKSEGQSMSLEMSLGLAHAGL